MDAGTLRLTVCPFDDVRGLYQVANDRLIVGPGPNINTDATDIVLYGVLDSNRNIVPASSEDKEVAMALEIGIKA